MQEVLKHRSAEVSDGAQSSKQTLAGHPLEMALTDILKTRQNVTKIFTGNRISAYIAYVNTCGYVFLYGYIYIYMYMYVCIYIFIDIYIYMCVCVCVCACSEGYGHRHISGSLNFIKNIFWICFFVRPFSSMTVGMVQMGAIHTFITRTVSTQFDATLQADITQAKNRHTWHT